MQLEGFTDVGQIAPYRYNDAQEALQLANDVLTGQYIADTVLAYLQSPSFFVLWFGTLFTILGYRLVKDKISNEQRQ